VQKPLYGLLYSIIFCTLSLLVAELLTTLLLELQLIDASEEKQTHTLIMIIAVIGYILIAPSLRDSGDNE